MNAQSNLLHRFLTGSFNWLRDIIVLIGGTYLVMHPIFTLGFNDQTLTASILNLVAMFMAGMMYFLYIGIFRGNRRCLSQRTFRTLTLIYMLVIFFTFWFFIHPLTYGMATGLFTRS